MRLGARAFPWCLCPAAPGSRWVHETSANPPKGKHAYAYAVRARKRRDQSDSHAPKKAAPTMKKAVHRARLAVTAQRLAAYLWLMRRTIQSPKLWMACTKKISRITTASMMSGRKRW